MANIQNELNNIKTALYGKDVRGSIHDGIEAINKEIENTTGRQVDLENTFDQLVINAGNSNAEIVDARVKPDGTSYSKLGDRLNEVDSQLEQSESKNYVTLEQFGAKGDGITDDTLAFKKCLDFLRDKDYKHILLVGERYIVQPQQINSHIIKIDYGNLIIEGNSKNEIYSRGYNGRPVSKCDDNEVGFIFYFDDAKLIENVTFKNITINGGVEDFDTTSKKFNERHKAIAVRSVNQTLVNNLKIIDCEIKNTLGEFVYSAGENGKLFIHNCLMYNSKGNGVTFSGETVIEYSKINKTTYGAIEQALWENKPCIIRGCSFEENGLASIGTQHGSTTKNYETKMLIEGNYFGKSTGNKNSNGVSITGSNGVDVVNNVFEDCTNNALGGNYACVQISTNVSYLPIQNVRNISIKNNKFIAKDKDLSSIIRISGLTPNGCEYGLENIDIIDNQIITYEGRKVGGHVVIDRTSSINNINARNNNIDMTGTLLINKGTSETKVLDTRYYNTKKIINIKGFVTKLANTGSVTVNIRYEVENGQFKTMRLLRMENDDSTESIFNIDFMTNATLPVIQISSIASEATNAVLHYQID